MWQSTPESPRFSLPFRFPQHSPPSDTPWHLLMWLFADCLSPLLDASSQRAGSPLGSLLYTQQEKHVWHVVGVPDTPGHPPQAPADVPGVSLTVPSLKPAPPTPPPSFSLFFSP